MSNLKEKLQGKISRKPSQWKQKASIRLKSPWLKEYSSKIAMRILAAIEDHPTLTQAEIARKLDVTPQQINKIVKGGENLTLETIYKISKVLEVDLISFPDFKYSQSISMQYGPSFKIEIDNQSFRKPDQSVAQLPRFTQWEWQQTPDLTYSATINMVG